MFNIDIYETVFHFINIFIEEEVMNEIKRIFTIEKLQFVWVVQEFNNHTIYQTFHLHVQIVLKEVVNKKLGFLILLQVSYLLNRLI